MKLLLDENLPHEMRHFLAGHEVATVSFMGWNGLSNGKLLAAAAGAGFEVLLTNDTEMEFQQERALLPLSILLIESPTNKIEHIWPLTPAIERALANIDPRSLARVSDFV